MRVAQVYSHLNGEEYLLVREPAAYEEIRGVVGAVDASGLAMKTSREKTMPGKPLLSPRALNAEFARHFRALGWQSVAYRYYVTTKRAELDHMINLPLNDQRDYLRSQGVAEPIRSCKQTDFVKQHVAVEVQFGKYAFVAFDLFVKHLLFYSGGLINVGVEILPMRAMLRDPGGGRRMSTGIAYFEGEVYNVMRHGRSSPPVPLVIIGIEP